MWPVILYPKIKEFIANNERLPEKNATDELEVKYAYALAQLRDMRARREQDE
ncbi:hypothetical protein [Ligilactobacillus acidipiscis]|uniref:hypothetical protein n=1 Tax=Ligilactobacillus acidipiscis TaxID=89059 RepID=UPI0023F7D4C4|nr:hypothetical protein [Ligilactobacillus acidipiscis]WEV56241.1 hypothetical protein OZX66_08335 [Ligilactobacillus acidipiscis]